MADNKPIAQDVLKAVGGPENVSNVVHCMTRLRFTLKDKSVPNDDEVKKITGVIMAEPAAGLLSDEDCQTYSTKYVRQVVEALQDDTFTIILHNCGNTGQCTQAMVDSGAAALHFGNAIDMRQALQACPTDVLVMGNIDPVGILKQSTPEVVYQKTLELLEQTASAKNYVLSTGCDVPMVPEANIQAFYQALDHFNSSL